ncbi:MAG: ExbD/TolR family protein [Nitrospinota bacterium]
MRFRSGGEEDFNLQLTSLIDVVFLLLIFFMVSTAFIDFSRRMDIQLPESKASQIVEEVRGYLLEVGVERRITLNGRDITLEELEKELMRTKGQGIRRTMTIKADKRLDYGFVVRLMGICLAAGIRDISVAVKD